MSTELYCDDKILITQFSGGSSDDIWVGIASKLGSIQLTMDDADALQKVLAKIVANHRTDTNS